MKTISRPLCHLWSGAKFQHNGKTYTIYQQESNMAEVFDGKRFWAWPHNDGKDQLHVNWITHV